MLLRDLEVSLGAVSREVVDGDDAEVGGPVACCSEGGNGDRGNCTELEENVVESKPSLFVGFAMRSLERTFVAFSTTRDELPVARVAPAKGREFRLRRRSALRKHNDLERGSYHLLASFRAAPCCLTDRR